jgi:hypothetical protein
MGDDSDQRGSFPRMECNKVGDTAPISNTHTAEMSLEERETRCV